MSKIIFRPSSFFNIPNYANYTKGPYPVLPNTAEPTKEECIQAFKWQQGIDDKEIFVGIILRHDQIKQINDRIDNYFNNEFVKTDLVHESEWFTNLNYVRTDNEPMLNYLKFYIYKVTFYV